MLMIHCNHVHIPRKHLLTIPGHRIIQTSPKKNCMKQYIINYLMLAISLSLEIGVYSTSESLTSPCIDDRTPKKPFQLPLTPPLHDVTKTDHDENSLPLPLTALYSDNYKCLDDISLKKSVRDVFNSITISKKECKCIERYTRSQRENSLWYEQRCGRLTASCFHDIVSRKSTSSPDNLVM